MTFDIDKRPLPPRSVLGRMRSWFFTGLVIFGPVAVTLYIVGWFIDTIDNWVRPLAPASLWPDTYLPIHVPGFGVIIAIIGLMLIGFLAANIAGRTLVSLGEAILDRTPVVRGIHRGVKQIFETVFAQNGTQFRKVGMVQFPFKGAWSIVFISSEPPSLIAERLPEDGMTSVFLPCTPNPTTGYFFYVPTKDVIELTITPEEAAKLIMSAGLIQPDPRPALAELARGVPFEPVAHEAAGVD